MVDKPSRVVVQRHTEFLRRCVSAVTAQPAQLSRRLEDPKRFTFEFLPKNEPVSLRLRTRPDRVLFTIKLEFALVETDRIHETSSFRVGAYSYQIADRFSNELLVYQWHPVGLSRVRTPHLHLGSFAAGNDAISIGETHLPTGIVSLKDIIRYLIEELGVEPNRLDWEQILTDVEAAD